MSLFSDINRVGDGEHKKSKLKNMCGASVSLASRVRVVSQKFLIIDIVIDYQYKLISAAYNIVTVQCKFEVNVSRFLSTI